VEKDLEKEVDPQVDEINQRLARIGDLQRSTQHGMDVTSPLPPDDD